MLRIVPFPHPALRYESRPITRIDDDLRAVVRSMFDLMYEARGIGLAANQVGFPFRFFVLNLTADPEQTDQEQVFLNPEIVKRHSTDEAEEGCLSFPGLYAKVRRPKRVRLQAYNLAGQEVEIDADDLYGRALQHETDHVGGRLFIDILSEPASAATQQKIRDIEASFRKAQAEGIYPDDDEIKRQLDAMERPTLG